MVTLLVSAILASSALSQEPPIEYRQELITASLAYMVGRYVSWDRSIKCVITGEANRQSQSSQSPSIGQVLKKRFNLDFSIGTNDSAWSVSPPGSIVNPETREPAVELDVEVDKSTSPSTATVVVTYSRNSQFTFPVILDAQRVKNEWKLRPRKESITITGANGGHSLQVRMFQGPVELKGKSITWKGTCYLIDGHLPLGMDGGIPSEELSDISVQVDGKKWTLPRNQWSDCYWHHMTKESVQAWISKDGERVTIKSRGGDAAGSYTVIWYMHRDGTHKRRIDFGDC